MIAGTAGLAGPGADIAPAGLAAAGAGLTVLRKQGWLLSVHANPTVKYKGLIQNALHAPQVICSSVSIYTHCHNHTRVAASVLLLPQDISIRGAHAKLGQQK